MSSLPVSCLSFIVCLSTLRLSLLVFWALAWIAQHRVRFCNNPSNHTPTSAIILIQLPLYYFSVYIANVFGWSPDAGIEDLAMGLCAAVFYAWFEHFRVEPNGGKWVLFGELITLCGFGVCYYRVLSVFLNI
jgi:hypothetical protein